MGSKPKAPKPSKEQRARDRAAAEASREQARLARAQREQIERDRAEAERKAKAAKEAAARKAAEEKTAKKAGQRGSDSLKTDAGGGTGFREPDTPNSPNAAQNRGSTRRSSSRGRAARARDLFNVGPGGPRAS